MKKRKSVLLLLLSGFFVALMSFYAAPPPAAPPPQQPDLEQNPPIPVAYWVKLLPQPLQNGNNMQVRIKYLELEPIPSSLAVYIGNNTVILYDDGTHTDAVAGDSIYTADVTENVTTFINTINSRIATLNQKPYLLSFTGHIGTQISSRISFNAASFQKNIEVSFDPALLTSIDCGSILKQNSLFITDSSVVEDPGRTYNVVTGIGNPMGIWTFGSIMTNIANNSATGVSAKNLIKSWLANYLNTSLQVNGQSIASRPHILDLLLGPWLVKAGTVLNTSNVTSATWDSLWNISNDSALLVNAPFKLTAIVNRLDLRGNTSYAPSVGNAGETRFIFTLIDPVTGRPPIQVNSNFTPDTSFYDWKGMNFIFEFGNPQNSLCNILNFANQWVGLSSLTLGDSAYLSALDTITRVVLNAGAGGSKINGSAINRIRTDERIFDNAQVGVELEVQRGWMFSDWEFRQFQLTSGTGLFSQVPLTNTPLNAANNLFGSATPFYLTGPGGFDPTIGENNTDQMNLINWIFSSRANIIRSYRGIHSMPDSFGNRPLLSGGAREDAEYLHFLNLNWPDPTDPAAPNFTASYSHEVLDSQVYYKQLRAQLSLNTCQGCHTGETNTLFTQVAPMGYGTKAKYWLTSSPDTTHGKIDERFIQIDPGMYYYPFTTPGPYTQPPIPEYIVKVSAFLTGYNYRSTSGLPAGTSNFYDDSTTTTEDSYDNTLNGLFYVYAPDNYVGVLDGTNIKYGYNDLERRKLDLCSLVNSGCSPFSTLSMLQLIAHMPLPLGSH